jgi:undecaprenyl-diphosphatase
VNPIQQFDRDLFVRINSDWSSSLGDQIFPLMTDLHRNPFFIAVLALGLVVWIARERTRALKWTVALILSVALTDLFSYRIVKANFERARPPQANVQVVVRGETHTGNSFPSNHSANMFAVAMAISGASPLASIPFFIAALLIGYSRVYVGAHFPMDVLGGAAIGILMATLVRIALRKWLPKSGADSSRERNSNP